MDSGIVETHIRDHCLVFAALNLRMPKPPAAYVVARSYKYYDPQSFLSDLNKIPWYENILRHYVVIALLPAVSSARMRPSTHFVIPCGSCSSSINLR